MIMPFGRGDLLYCFIALLTGLEILHLYWATLVNKKTVKFHSNLKPILSLSECLLSHFNLKVWSQTY
ncbi:hypothetical protein HK096_001138, partial [Nowakowskiella sp. JEL0078]